MLPDEIPQELLDAYHERCNVEATPLEEFVDEVKGQFSSEALDGLLHRVEATVAENVSLMVAANPELEEVAAKRLAGLRELLTRIRGELG